MFWNSEVVNGRADTIFEDTKQLLTEEFRCEKLVAIFTNETETAQLWAWIKLNIT